LDQFLFAEVAQGLQRGFASLAKGHDRIDAKRPAQGAFLAGKAPHHDKGHFAGFSNAYAEARDRGVPNRFPRSRRSRFHVL
jgi:hypothetical protein